jgi:hypothetical protein
MVCLRNVLSSLALPGCYEDLIIRLLKGHPKVLVQDLPESYDRISLDND